jgi:hypothetical protein
MVSSVGGVLVKRQTGTPGLNLRYVMVKAHNTFTNDS